MKKHQDATLIEALGGATKVAELLDLRGESKSGGVQRVHNWITRGIPARVKLEHPELFLKAMRRKETA